MTDRVLEELWQIKDEIAAEQGYDIARLADFFQRKQIARDGSRFCAKDKDGDTDNDERDRSEQQLVEPPPGPRAALAD